MKMKMKPSLLTLARRALGGEAKIPKGGTLLVAVSGGPDSMALLHALATLAPKLGLGVVAHGVDHGLREGASAELDLAEALAKAKRVPFARTRLELARGGNLQERARVARYEALAVAATRAGASAVATAHHADDRAETLLIRLLRGAGPRGLGVLPARAPYPISIEGVKELELVRPLLRARRVDVMAHLARHQISFATDPSNDDARYLRARVRHELLPLLEDLGPGIVDHLNTLADRLADGADVSASTFRLTGATETALRELAASRSPTARVWLPGGLVARVAPPGNKPRARSRGNG